MAENYIHTNEFTLLANILYKSRKNVVNILQWNHDQLELEIIRIRLKLLVAWSENKEGLQYYLDFHHAEASRLHCDLYDPRIAINFESGTDLSYNKLFYCIYGGLRDIIQDIREMKGEALSLPPDIEN